MAYNKLTPELAEELKGIVGADQVLLGEDINEDYSRDEMPLYGKHMPEAVVFVQSTEEVSAIMKLASANKLPVTVRGSGTGLV
ncbi:MAG: FAD-binding oxidoreductase, partial [Oscillospiraceae bacterium]|nr:FAD-binding oxidoreductase [Oscillospiraceae bacterium]